MGCVGQGFTDPDAGSPGVIFVGSQYGTCAVLQISRSLVISQLLSVDFSLT